MYDSCFKSYDIRSVYGEPLDIKFAYNLGIGIGQHLYSSIGPDATLIFGSDVRQANNEIIDWFITGLEKSGITNYYNAGIHVENMGDQYHQWGVCSSSFLYYFGKNTFDLGVVFTASHNPPEYVGMKIIDTTGQLIPSLQLKNMISEYIPLDTNHDADLSKSGKEKLELNDLVQKKLESLHSLLTDKFTSLSGTYNIVIDFSNGAAVAYEQEFFKHIAGLTNINITYICDKADTNYSIHQSDTQVPHDYETLIEKVVETSADLGIMFDGDGDRLGFVDHAGTIVEGDIITGIIASDMLKKSGGGIIVHDVFTSRTVIDKIQSLGGTPVKCRVGHTHVKKLMQENGAIFGGENSGHLFFPEVGGFEFPLLALFHVMSEMEATRQSLNTLAEPYLIFDKMPLKKIGVENTDQSLGRVIDRFTSKGYKVDNTDGIGIYDNDFWFVLRPSNTEPVLKLVIESQDQAMTKELLQEIQDLL